ncbi:MAG: CPBP family intramembrane metalloprotease [Firmicutes bacterium]|nr:CPBP family intramembrane metalloprotease [Bacillota bacterium]
MNKQESPTVAQANTLFFITAVLTLAGSALFQPILGLGTNLWINEFVYILFPALLLARVNDWPVEEVYRFRKTAGRNVMISIFSGVCMWFFAFYISKSIRMLLDAGIGVMTGAEQTVPSIYQSYLLVIGTVVLAPICEETFFRGLMQKAYEGYSKRYGFVITAIIFGFFHILNGISEVIPAGILGLGMGYLLDKTGSIATSMLFHAAANLCAILLGGAFDRSFQSVMPVWLHVVAFTGLGLSIFLLSSVRGEKQPEEDGEVQTKQGVSATGVLFLILSAIFLLAIGVLEILTRLNILQA